MTPDSASNWKDIIDILSSTAGGAARGIAQSSRSKKELKEAKRQTYADLLKNAMRRNMNQFKSETDYRDEMSDLNTEALQSLARGFADTFRGASWRRRKGYGNV